MIDFTIEDVRQLADRGNISHRAAQFLLTFVERYRIYEALHQASVWELLDAEIKLLGKAG